MLAIWPSCELSSLYSSLLTLLESLSELQDFAALRRLAAPLERRDLDLLGDGDLVREYDLRLDVELDLVRVLLRVLDLDRRGGWRLPSVERARRCSFSRLRKSFSSGGILKKEKQIRVGIIYNRIYIIRVRD